MMAWIRGLLEDESKFTALMRGLLGTAGATIATLPPEALAGYGKYGAYIMALAMFLRAGDRNP